MNRIDQFLTWADKMFNRHMLIRRSITVGLVFWATWLITVVTFKAMQSPEQVNEHVANIVLTISGLLTVVVGFYKWSRNK